MIQGRSRSGVLEGISIPGVGQALIRRVRFQKNSIERNLQKRLPLPHLAFVCEVSRETKVSAQSDEFGNHFRGPTVAVEQESAGGPGLRHQEVAKAPERPETVNARCNPAMRNGLAEVIGAINRAARTDT